MVKYSEVLVKYWLKHEKNKTKIDEILVKYPKILVDGYIFPNFVSGSIDIGCIEDILTIYLDILNLAPNNVFYNNKPWLSY